LRKTGKWENSWESSLDIVTAQLLSLAGQCASCN